MECKAPPLFIPKGMQPHSKNMQLNVLSWYDIVFEYLNLDFESKCMLNDSERFSVTEFCCGTAVTGILPHMHAQDFKKGISRGSCGTIYLGRLRQTDVTIKKALVNKTFYSPRGPLNAADSVSDVGKAASTEPSQSHEHCLKREVSKCLR